MIDKLIRFGCPYHGMIKGGEIHLPNDGRQATPQPVGMVDGDLAGSTYLQRMPWAPGGVDTEEDVLAGRHWADYAILGGCRQMLHGKALSGWIYAAPDGKPWWVDISNLLSVSVGNSFSRTVRLRPFGQVGRPGSTRSVSVSLSSTGQSTPSLTGARSLWLADITPDGSRAILEVVLITEHNPDPGLGRIYPVGYWLLELTGSGSGISASLSVLRTRAEVLGTMSDSGPIPQVPFPYTTYGISISGSGGGVYTITWAGAEHNVAYREDGARHISVTGRIVGMWFDSAGNPTEVTLNMTRSISVSSAYTDESTGGPLIQTSLPGGGSSWSGSELVRISVDEVEASDTLTFTLANQGVARSFTMAKSISNRETRTRIPYGDNATGPQGVHESEFQSALDTPWHSWASAEEAIITGTGSEMTPQQQAMILNGYPFMSIPGSGAVYLGLLRYSNNLMRLALVRTDSSPYEWYLSGALTPAGPVGGSTSTDADHRYASWNPATNEIAGPADEPVCFT